MKGMAWTGVSRLLKQVIQFSIGILLARQLMPEDYGIIGMLAIFIAIAETFLDSGFASALIQKKDRTEVDYSTVFFFNVVVSLVLYAIIFVSAPWIADFYSLPVLTDVTRVVSLALIINGLTIIQTAKLSIELNFHLQAIADILSVLIGGLLALYLAYHGWGVWALVFQGIGSATIRAMVLWLFSRWHPLWAFSYESFRRLFSFGSKLLCSGMINTIYDNLYTLVIGKAFTASQVGFFNRGDHFAQLPTKTIQEMVVKVNYPILSSMQDDEAKLTATYKKLLTAPMFLLYPILTLLIVLAAPLVELLIGAKWLPCVPILQIICIGCLFDPLTHINLNLLYVKGRTDLVLKLEFLKKPIGFLLLFLSIPFGVLWMCVGRSLYSLIAYIFNCYYTNKMIHYGFFSQMKALLPIILRSLLMGLVVYFVMMVFGSLWAKLVFGTFVGIVSYILFCIISKDGTYKDVRSMVIHSKYGQHLFSNRKC